MSLALKKRALINYVQSQPSGRLPSGYQEVEYIQSSGTQYIATDTSVSNPSSFKCQFKWIKTDTGTSDQCIAGAREVTSYTYGFKGANCYNNKLELAPNFQPNISFTDNTLYESVFEGKSGSYTFTLNGTTTTSTNSYTNFNTYNLKIYIFAMNQDGSPRWYFKGRIYYYTMWLNGTKVFDLVPCYRTLDNEIGLYDLVNDVFYTNQGSGSFSKGNDINVPPFDDTLENNTWDTIKAVIDSGYKPSTWLGQTKEITSGTLTGYHCQFVDNQTSRYAKTDGNGNSNCVFEVVELKDYTTRMNATRTNIGGYAQSELRTKLNNDVYNSLPDDLKAVISQVKIKSSAGNQQTTITESDNYLFVPSEYELYGTATYSVGATEGQPQFDYYVGTSNSAKVKYLFGTSSANGYWERSPYPNSAYEFCNVAGAGQPSYNDANTTRSCAWCFAI